MFRNSYVPNSLADADPKWAWQAYEPTDSQPWNLELATHLFRRAAFGGTWRELQQALQDGPEKTVDHLLAGGDKKEEFYRGVETSAEALLNSPNAVNLSAWWLHTMIHTPHPVLEKTTLFWHNHFATSAAKVDDPRLILQQHRLMKKYALVRFEPMLAEMAKDPAMLLWLDSASNKKLHPNENFAREVMELFSLGLGAYTEKDIQEAARAFTGWEVRQNKFRFNQHQHDVGMKTVLGRTGAFNGDDIIPILLEQPAAGRFLTKKLFASLVSESDAPSAALIEPLAMEFRRHDYDMSWLLKTIFRSNLFYSPLAVRQRIKSPVEYAIGLLRSLGGSSNAFALAQDLLQMGQGVFFPPNVKGWDGGREWINSSTLVSRANLVWGLVGGADSRYAGKVKIAELDCFAGLTDQASKAQRLVDLLLGQAVPDAIKVQLSAIAADNSERNDSTRLARVIHAIATLPEFQLS